MRHLCRPSARPMRACWLLVSRRVCTAPMLRGGRSRAIMPGVLLYRTLYDFGFASSPVSEQADDGLQLIDCRITNVVKCLPPENKPVAAEVNACSRFLMDELDPPDVLLALGGVAHKAVIRAYGLRQKDYVFGHGAEHALNERQVLIDSYHCSRYNTNTRRLTPRMFADVFAVARKRLA